MNTTPFIEMLKKNGILVRETESHGYVITLDTNKYTVAYYLFKNLLSKNKYLKDLTISVCEFSINVSCDTLRVENQMTLDDNLWTKTVGYILNYFKRYFKNIPASYIKTHLDKIIKSTLKSNDITIPDETVLLISNFISNSPKAYKEIDNIRKHSPILYSKLEWINGGDFHTAGELGNMGFDD